MAVIAGAAGALLGDSLMTQLIARPLTTGPHVVQAPIAETLAFGALVAGGLAWAERPFSRAKPATSVTSTDDPEKT
jgi:hypothetical protein